MEITDNKIHFESHFVSDKGIISNKDRSDVPAILSVDAMFSIKMNHILYFEAELPILEFYKSLYTWKERITKDCIPEFHYYSIEHDEEEGAILSVLPFSNKARLESIWSEADIDNVLDLHYIVHELLTLESRLGNDIEKYYNIRLKYFMKHIPYSLTSMQ
ncbi:hypothetical protein CAI16_18410 [Virgibacillus dokdonensis]|uniref:DUF7878 domain-containing protein n=1 Tax=Virgibacillus dokdonensis TaxID=302167 RepID=A0A3E0WJK4_9BACI|nr:hypothetical protein [Virgibacillus dokdonensis]RFA32321.1 hypothetical protein CAI16_18410 [Virgibacillus dokdonensis]